MATVSSWNQIWPRLADGTDGDQTLALDEQIAAAPNGEPGYPTWILLPSGRFRVDGGVKLRDRAHLRVTCPVGTFRAHTDKTSADLGLLSREHFAINNCVDVLGSHLFIEGPNTGRYADHPEYASYIAALESDHAFRISTGSVDSGWEDCAFVNVHGDGLNVGFPNAGIANRNCFARRISGSHAGRQALAITHADGFVGEDISIDYVGRSGLDIEPNSPNDKVWNVDLTRCAFGSHFYPFAITGADNGTYPQRQNIRLKDCRTIRCAHEHTALLASRGPSTDLIVDGLIDTRQNTEIGLNVRGAWENVTIRNCTVTTSNNTPTSYAVSANTSGVLRIHNNLFNGKPNTEGFDELVELIRVPAYFAHSGNVWAMGTRTD